MTAIELQDFLHVYSMISFRDGRKEPGGLVADTALRHIEIMRIDLAADAVTTAARRGGGRCGAGRALDLQPHYHCPKGHP